MTDLAPYTSGAGAATSASAKRPGCCRDWNGWIRRRLRASLWKQWKTGVGRGMLNCARRARPRLASKTAGSLRPLASRPHQGPSIALPNDYLPLLGLPSLSGRLLVKRFRTAVYGPVRTVVWEGSGAVTAPPIPILSPLPRLTAGCELKPTAVGRGYVLPPLPPLKPHTPRI